jgi:hypothetical protein
LDSGGVAVKKIVLLTMLLLIFVPNVHAGDLWSGMVGTEYELTMKIEELKELIFFNYQKSGIRLWAPFFYWNCKRTGQIVYSYTLLPLGQKDDSLMNKMNLDAGSCEAYPVYVPVKINRAGSMRS